MRRLILAVALVLVMAVPAFAQITNVATGLAATIKDNNQNQNTNLNTDVNTNVNTFVPVNTNIQGQQQGQLQGQMQGQGQLQGQVNVNDQVIAPKQVVLFQAPTPLLGTPSQSVPELNFGNGRMSDATSGLPNFAIYGIGKLGKESIREVISVNANVKFKKLYKEILADAKAIAGNGSKTFKDIRYQVIRSEANKSWATGGNIGGGGSGLLATGLGGGAGAGAVVPQWGGTKADDLFTIIFVRVAL